MNEKISLRAFTIAFDSMLVILALVFFAIPSKAVHSGGGGENPFPSPDGFPDTSYDCNSSLGITIENPDFGGTQGLRFSITSIDVQKWTFIWVRYTDPNTGVLWVGAWIVSPTKFNASGTKVLKFEAWDGVLTSSQLSSYTASVYSGRWANGPFVGSFGSNVNVTLSGPVLDVSYVDRDPSHWVTNFEDNVVRPDPDPEPDPEEDTSIGNLCFLDNFTFSTVNDSNAASFPFMDRINFYWSPVTDGFVDLEEVRSRVRFKTTFTTVFYDSGGLPVHSVSEQNHEAYVDGDSQFYRFRGSHGLAPAPEGLSYKYVSYRYVFEVTVSVERDGVWYEGKSSSVTCYYPYIFNVNGDNYVTCTYNDTAHRYLLDYTFVPLFDPDATPDPDVTPGPDVSPSPNPQPTPIVTTAPDGSNINIVVTNNNHVDGGGSGDEHCTDHVDDFISEIDDMGNFFQTWLAKMRNFREFPGEIGTFLQESLVWIPQEDLALVTMGISSVILIGIWRMIRG